MHGAELGLGESWMLVVDLQWRVESIPLAQAGCLLALMESASSAAHPRE